MAANTKMLQSPTACPPVPYQTSQPEFALPTIISLFCGAGGLDYGFKQAGFKIAVAFDAFEAAIETHKQNFPECNAQVQDFTKVAPKDIVAEIKRTIPSHASVAIIGGPPCQGFSRANTKSSADDPRNKLAKIYLKIIDEIKKNYNVDFVLLENVPGIKDQKHKKNFSYIENKLKRIGRVIFNDILNSSKFGTPQNRERVLLVSADKNLKLNKLKPEESKQMLTVRDAIFGLPEPTYFHRNADPRTFAEHPNHWTMRPKSKKFTQSAETASNGRSFRKLDWDKPSPTVAYGNREIHVHPSGHRRLSIYEAMLLQGFPETFRISGTLSQQVEQVSNAVPPPMAKSVAIALRTTLLERDNAKHT